MKTSIHFLCLFLLLGCASKPVHLNSGEFINYVLLNNLKDETLNKDPNSEEFYANSLGGWTSTQSFQPSGLNSVLPLYLKWSKQFFANSQKPEGIDLLKLSPAYRPSSKHLANEIYNRFLIRFKYSNPSKELVIRPVEVDTGCDSQCLPLVFHLVFQKSQNNSFSFLDIIQEPKRPLTKVGHQPLTFDEISLLKSNISRELPGHFNNWASAHTTDLLVSGMGQTWTFLKPFVVEGGAYTSYRVYELSRKTLEFLNGQAIYTIQPITDPVRSLLLESESQDLSLDLENIFLGNPDIISKYPRLALATVSWRIQKGASRTRYSEIVKRYKFDLFEECLFQNLILNTPEGQNYFLRSFNRNNICPSLNLELISQSLSHKNDKDLVLPVNVPRYFANNKMLFLKAIQQSQNKTNSFRGNWVQEFLLRYPNAVNLLPENDKVAISQQSRRNFLELRFGNSIKSEYSNPFIDKLKAYSFSKNSSESLSDARVIVFISSTCPHCVDFFRQFKTSSLYKQTKAKVKIVHLGSSLKNRDWVDSFCADTNWEKSECLNNLNQVYAQDPNVVQTLKALNYSGTPHLMVFDSNKKLLIPKFPLEINHNDPASTRSLFDDLYELILSF